MIQFRVSLNSLKFDFAATDVDSMRWLPFQLVNSTGIHSSSDTTHEETKEFGYLKTHLKTDIKLS